MVSSNKLWRAGIWAVALPLSISFACQSLIWLIPDCNPNPYSLDGCVVAGYGLAPALITGLLGGIYGAVALGLFVSLPLFIVAMFLKRRKQNSSR